MDPPGRFLKQDASTNLWHDIGKKEALTKIRQALREGTSFNSDGRLSIS